MTVKTNEENEILAAAYHDRLNILKAQSEALLDIPKISKTVEKTQKRADALILVSAGGFALLTFASVSLSVQLAIAQEKIQETKTELTLIKTSVESLEIPIASSACETTNPGLIGQIFQGKVATTRCESVPIN